VSRLIAASPLCLLAADLLVIEFDDSGPLKLRLFQNDYVPVRATVLGDLTQATVAGYAAQDISEFGIPTDEGGQVWKIEADENTFTLDGSGTPQFIYGYYVTNNSGSELYWSERFDVPYNVDEAAFVITVRPQLTVRSLFGI